MALKLINIAKEISKLYERFYKQADLIIDELKNQLSNEIRSDVINKVKVGYRRGRTYEIMEIEISTNEQISRNRSHIGHRTVIIMITSEGKFNVYYTEAKKAYRPRKFSTVNKFLKGIPEIKRFILKMPFNYN